MTKIFIGEQYKIRTVDQLVPNTTLDTIWNLTQFEKTKGRLGPNKYGDLWRFEVITTELIKGDYYSFFNEFETLQDAENEFNNMFILIKENVLEIHNDNAE